MILEDPIEDPGADIDQPGVGPPHRVGRTRRTLGGWRAAQSTGHCRNSAEFLPRGGQPTHHSVLPCYKPCYNISQYGICYKSECNWYHPEGCWVPNGSAANYPGGVPSSVIGLMKGPLCEKLHRIMSDILHSATLRTFSELLWLASLSA